MGYIEFESVEAANAVADSLGLERPYRARLGDEADPALKEVKDILAMSFSVAEMKGERLTTAELLRQAGY